MVLLSVDKQQDSHQHHFAVLQEDPKSKEGFSHADQELNGNRFQITV